MVSAAGEEYYEEEIQRVTGNERYRDPGGSTYSADLRRQKIPESDPYLQRIVMIEKDLAHRRSDEAGFLRDLHQRMREGIVTGAVHTVSRAGKENESSSWYLFPQATQTCMAE